MPRWGPLLGMSRLLVNHEPVKRQAGFPFIRKETSTGSFAMEPWVVLRAGRWVERRQRLVVAGCLLSSRAGWKSSSRAKLDRPS